jgi:cysteine-rich repeat protein
MDPVCGDGMVEGDEVCDDGDDNGSYGFCLDDCTAAGPSCGDGNLDADHEQCDDGDDNGSYDSCTEDCQGHGPTCGDGNIDAGNETCDDGADNGSYDMCAADCQGPASYCGDGVHDAAYEDCDDGDDINGNGCNNDCVVSGSTLWEVTKTTIGTTSADEGRDIVAMGDMLRVISWTQLNGTTQQVHLTDYTLDGSESSEHVHTNVDYPDTRLDPGRLHEEGTYNIVTYDGNAASPPRYVDVWSADHSTEHFTAVMSDSSRARRRTGGGLLFVQPESNNALSRYIIREESGTFTFVSAQDSALRYHRIEEVESDILLVEEANAGTGFERAIARHTVSGDLVFRTFFESTHNISDFAWENALLATGEDGSSSLALRRGSNVVVVKFAQDGSFLWETLLESENTLEPFALAIDSSGNVVLAGRDVSPTDSDAILVKVDATGVEQWRRLNGGPGYQVLFGVTTLDDDSVAVTGTYSPVSQTARDIWTARFAP